jgi:hypothetical protein
MISPSNARSTLFLFLFPLLPPLSSEAQEGTTSTVSCASKPGARQHCPADTSAGVVLQRVTGNGPCVLGKSWSYDGEGIWVSDGCAAEFVVGQSTAGASTGAPAKPDPKVSHTRNLRVNVQVIDIHRAAQSSLFGFYVGGQTGTTISAAMSFLF